MKIALVYNRECENTTGVHLQKVIENAKISCDHFWTERFSQIPKGYDLYFRIDHGDYKYDLPQYLRPAVFYAIDTHLKKPYKKIKKQVGHYQVVFCAQKQGADRLRKETRVDTQWVPLGFDPQVHRKLDIEKKYNIGFIGSEARKFLRGQLIDVLRKKYPDSHIGGADFRKISEIYSASKIGFNYSIVNDINMRIFEIMACGSFLLTNRIKNNGFFELFQEGKHLRTYSNQAQLLELVEYYLNHDQEREKIAQAGRELVVNNYTYYHTVQKMFNYLAFKFGGDFNRLRI